MNRSLNCQGLNKGTAFTDAERVARLLVIVARSCEFSFPAWPGFPAHRRKVESSEKGERRC